MICPPLTYYDLGQALRHEQDTFGPTIAEVPDGVVVAQRDRPADLRGTHVGTSWIRLGMSERGG
jgi:hypothetical protein